MTTEPLIDARNVFRYYGHHCAVQDLNLELRPGEVLGLLGPNGAGKSSTLQMLSGNLAPSTGNIHICGADLIEQPRQARTYIGYLPERPPLYGDLTVDEFLRFCARLHRIARTHTTAALDEALQRCALTDVRQRLIRNLSRGYQQRVGIAQAIIHTPRVVILDEPTVGLDPIQINEIRKLIRTLAEQHSVILSTHILPEVQAVCDRVQIIHEGRTVFADSLAGLEQRHRKPALTVHFERPPTREQLLALRGVVDVETQADGRMRITHGAENIAAALTTAAVENNWGLIELTPERVSLEQIFMGLIYRDEQNRQDEQNQDDGHEIAA